MLSTWSTTSLEDVAEAGGSCLKWFQLYIYKDKELTESLVRRAERAGYKAIAITVDTPIVGHRIIDARNKFNLPPHLGLPNFSSTVPQSTLTSDDPVEGSFLYKYTTDLLDPSLTWESIDWIRGITRLPILVKGILTAEDAREALKHNIQGIIVSNHGARQLDGVPATVSRAFDMAMAGLLRSESPLYVDRCTE